MTTLDPQLDKLRNKELSFGCYYKEVDGDCLSDWLYATFFSYRVIAEIYYDADWLPYIGNYLDVVGVWDDFTNEPERSITIIWHPLTRWRIFKLHRTHEAWDAYNDLHRFFCEYEELADKDETERMTSPKRPELRELLIQFSNYV